MFAVVEINGKQVLVKEKDVIEVNKILDTTEGASVTFDQVLAVFSPDAKTVDVGTPYLTGRSVTARIVSPEIKGDKVIGAKFKKRKRYTRTLGHRQRLTVLEIQKIA